MATHAPLALRPPLTLAALLGRTDDPRQNPPLMLTEKLLGIIADLTRPKGQAPCIDVAIAAGGDDAAGSTPHTIRLYAGAPLLGSGDHAVALGPYWHYKYGDVDLVLKLYFLDGRGGAALAAMCYDTQLTVHRHLRDRCVTNFAFTLHAGSAAVNVMFDGEKDPRPAYLSLMRFAGAPMGSLAFGIRHDPTLLHMLDINTRGPA